MSLIHNFERILSTTKISVLYLCAILYMGLYFASKSGERFFTDSTKLTIADIFGHLGATENKL